MKQFYKILPILILICHNGYGQFNLDAKKIKSKKIRTVTFGDNKQCSFDQEGRLIEFCEGDFSDPDKLGGEYTKHRFDSIGNILEINAYTIYKLKIDTTCVCKSEYKNKDLVTSFCWEETGHQGCVYYFYTNKRIGDSLIEQILSYDVLYKQDTIYQLLDVKITIDESPVKTKFSTFKTQSTTFLSDAELLDLSSHYISWTTFEFDKKQRLKASTIINDLGDTTHLCADFKIKNDNYTCNCKTSFGTFAKTFSKNQLYPSFFSIPFEYHQELCLRPFSSLQKGPYNTIIEYYE